VQVRLIISVSTATAFTFSFLWMPEVRKVSSDASFYLLSWFQPVSVNLQGTAEILPPPNVNLVICQILVFYMQLLMIYVALDYHFLKLFWGGSGSVN